MVVGGSDSLTECEIHKGWPLMNCVQSLIGSHSLDSQHSDMGCVPCLWLALVVRTFHTLTPPSWILLHFKILKGNISEMNLYKHKIDSPREAGNVQ